jgi:2-C-methyl-D-erythritol 2,4-cyclodiphosphate synthase
MIRTGFGYDIHRLVPGRKLILGGIEIPSEFGLLGHSDADVLLHAICDALLGAAALGDIGQHFSDTDPRFRGISSLVLLEETRRLLGERRFNIINVDSSLVLQRPKIAKFVPAMREKIASVLGIDITQIGVKATTNEELDALGRGEGCAAYAVATIETSN